MLTFLAILHVIFALGLIAFVLLQDPKGGAAGVFGGGGGGSNSLFGATGAGNFLTTGTKWCAIAFAVSCLTLAYLTTESNKSILDTQIEATDLQTPSATDAITPVPARETNVEEKEQSPESVAE